MCIFVFFFNDTATTEIYTLSLHDALPISGETRAQVSRWYGDALPQLLHLLREDHPQHDIHAGEWETALVLLRSEEHTSELQSRQYLVCRLLLEKKKKQQVITIQSNLDTHT